MFLFFLLLLFYVVPLEPVVPAVPVVAAVACCADRFGAEPVVLTGRRRIGNQRGRPADAGGGANGAR